jgi:hypothetical protein
MRGLPAFDGRADGLRIAHVEADQFALSADGGEGLLRRGFVGDVVDEDVIAHLGEFLADGAADAAAAAGDECGFHR